MRVCACSFYMYLYVYVRVHAWVPVCSSVRVHVRVPACPRVRLRVILFPIKCVCISLPDIAGHCVSLRALARPCVPALLVHRHLVYASAPSAFHGTFGCVYLSIC